MCSSIVVPENNGRSGLLISIFLLPSLSSLLTQCDRCQEDCVGAHGCSAGIASHGSIILSRGRLVTVEAPGYPRHPSSIQHDAVVNLPYKCARVFVGKFLKKYLRIWLCQELVQIHFLYEWTSIRDYFSLITGLQ